MEVLVVLGLAVGMVWLFDRLGLVLSNGVVRLLVRGFVAWMGGKLDPWPRGVQEEDRDKPWGSGRETSKEPEPPPVALTKVHAAIRH